MAYGLALYRNEAGSPENRLFGEFVLAFGSILIVAGAALALILAKRR
jgi:hypothetical protein